MELAAVRCASWDGSQDGSCRCRMQKLYDPRLCLITRLGNRAPYGKVYSPFCFSVVFFVCSLLWVIFSCTGRAERYCTQLAVSVLEHKSRF